MSFSLHFPEACTNFYKYLKAAAIFELIYLIFGKRKIFNGHWAESTADGPVALGTGLVFGPAGFMSHLWCQAWGMPTAR
jgi:hypothetical protein